MSDRRIVLVIDRDEYIDEALEKICSNEALDSTHVWQRREIENYLLDPEAISEVIKAKLVAKGVHDDDVFSNWGPDPIRSHMEALAEAEKPSIRRRRVKAYVFPTPFEFHDTKAVNPASDPEGEKQEITKEIKANLTDNIRLAVEHIEQKVSDAVDKFEEEWMASDPLILCSAKKILSKLRQQLADERQVCFNNRDILGKLTTIDEDVLEAIQKITN